MTQLSMFTLFQATPAVDIQGVKMSEQLKKPDSNDSGPALSVRYRFYHSASEGTVAEAFMKRFGRPPERIWRQTGDGWKLPLWIAGPLLDGEK